MLKRALVRALGPIVGAIVGLTLPAAADTAARDDGKVGDTCTGCHGSAATGQYWPGAPAYTAHGAGAHGAHVLSIGRYLGYGEPGVTLYSDTQQKTICAVCHRDPGGPGHDEDGGGDGRADVHTGREGDGFLRFVGSQTLGADTHTAGAYDGTHGTCSGVDCHYETTTPAYGGLGWNDPGPQAVDCDTCHYHCRGTAPTAPMGLGAGGGWLPDAHAAHVAGVAAPSDRQSKSYACSMCHDERGYTASHLDGQVQVSTVGVVRRSGSEKITGPAGTTPMDPTVKFGAGAATSTCSNFYCHGAGFSAGSRGTDVTPQWNDHATGACGTCHAVDANPVGTRGNQLTQGAHGKHMGGAGGPPATRHSGDCTYCHGIKSVSGTRKGCNAELCHPSRGSDLPGGPSDRGWVSSPSVSHVEGGYRVDFQNQERGWNWFNEYVAGGAGPAAVSLENTDICDRCHSTQDIGGGRVGARLAKGAWDSPVQLDCATCHNSSVPAYTTPVNGGTSVPIVDTVTGVGSHLKVATGDTLDGSTHWLTQCVKCHTGHVGTAGGVDIPLPPASYKDGTGVAGLNMRTVLGLNYDGHKGIHLGGTATAGTTEAEICWNCHYADTGDGGVATHFAEFGGSDDGAIGSRLSTWNGIRRGAWWEVEGVRAATWRKGQAASPSQDQGDAPLRSMHAADLAHPVPGLKLTSTLRCSYCHDVHDRNLATRATGKGLYADTLSGPPYLRGSWRGSLSPEGRVLKGGADGLCVLCHGDAPDRSTPCGRGADGGDRESSCARCHVPHAARLPRLLITE